MHRAHYQTFIFIEEIFFWQDIADTFEGNFKEQSGLNSNWLPVNSAQVCIASLFSWKVYAHCVYESAAAK